MKEVIILIKRIIKNYKQSLILILAIIIGTILGLILKSDAQVLSPLGDIFINLLYVVIVPLIFLTITTSISKMESPKRLKKLIGTIFLVFIITSLVSVFIGLIATSTTKLVEVDDSAKILETLDKDYQAQDLEVNILERTVQALTVHDFKDLLSKDNILPLIVFSFLFGCSLNMSKEKTKPLINILESLTTVTMNLIKIIMYYAPIGICCYFAALIGSFGASIAVGYLKTFIIYLIVSILFYLIIYTIYAYISKGFIGVKKYWKNILPATLTSISTCSSAASIPINIECAKKIGIPDDIAETTIPLGTSFHKDGSIIGSVFKIMFLVSLFNTQIIGVSLIAKIVLVSLIATILIAAVPIGGGTISEMLIISMMGYPQSALPILTIIATIIDAPATMLNVVGDTASSMLVTRIVEGKNW
jgi:Na+/H+-dicarboxylate symporter